MATEREESAIVPLVVTRAQGNARCPDIVSQEGTIAIPTSGTKMADSHDREKESTEQEPGRKLGKSGAPCPLFARCKFGKHDAMEVAGAAKS